MRSLFKKKIDWDKLILWSIYGILFLALLTAFEVLRHDREKRTDWCDNRHGLLIQDKTGEFYCIREKSIITK